MHINYHISIHNTRLDYTRVTHYHRTCETILKSSELFLTQLEVRTIIIIVCD